MKLIITRITQIIILLSIFGFSIFTGVNKTLNYIEDQEYLDAVGIISEHRVQGKFSYEWFYLEALLYSRVNFSEYNVEFAYDAIRKAERDYSKENEKKITYNEITILKDEIEKRYLPLLYKMSNEELNFLISRYPDSELAFKARSLKTDNRLRTILATHDVIQLDSFIKNHSDHEYISQVVEMKHELAFEDALCCNTVDALDYFIKQYPGSRQVTEAKRIRNNLSRLTLLEEESKITELKMKEQDALVEKEKAEIKALEAQSETMWVTIFSLFLLAASFVAGIVFMKRDKTRLLDQKVLIEEKNEHIMDSVRYAEQLQRSMLPAAGKIRSVVEDMFIYYVPRDVVSGDFYWFAEKGGDYYLAVADCTGHGVPGSMISMVGVFGLSNAMNDFGFRKPDKILDKLREEIIETFKDKDESRRDGMDISLCRINRESLMLQFAGAFNNLLIIRGKELIELKADRQPIGYHIKMNPFTLHEFQLIKGDKIFMYTDGFIDQFGGEEGSKYMKKAFKNLLLSLSDLQMAEIRQRLNTEYQEWKGDYDQLDDICVLGITV